MFESIARECVRVCLSMSKSKVRPGDSCLSVMCKGDAELGEGMWAFVSISGKTDGDLKYCLAVFLFFDLRECREELLCSVLFKQHTVKISHFHIACSSALQSILQN